MFAHTAYCGRPFDLWGPHQSDAEWAQRALPMDLLKAIPHDQCCQIGPDLATLFMFLMLRGTVEGWSIVEEKKRGGGGGLHAKHNKTQSSRNVFEFRFYLQCSLLSFPVLDMKRGIPFILIKYLFFLLK